MISYFGYFTILNLSMKETHKGHIFTHFKTMGHNSVLNHTMYIVRIITVKHGAEFS